jgi:hypothetical protein
MIEPPALPACQESHRIASAEDEQLEEDGLAAVVALLLPIQVIGSLLEVGIERLQAGGQHVLYSVRVEVYKRRCESAKQHQGGSESGP